MSKISADNINLVSRESYLKEKKIIKEEYKYIVGINNELWGFEPPSKVDIYIEKSFVRFCYKTYPLYKKIIVFSILFPFWYFHASKMWKFFSGTVIIDTKNGYPCAIIKPIEDLSELNFGITELIYKEKQEPTEIFKKSFYRLMVNVSCKTNLPMWFQAGLSIFTKEKAVEKRTIKQDTLNLFKDNRWSINTVDTFKESKSFDVKVFAYNYVKGYWTVKYLEENYPGYLKELFQEYDGNEIIKKIGKKLGLPISDKNEFYKELDLFLYHYYAQRLNIK